MVAQRHPSNAVQRHHGISVNHGDQRRNYSGDDAADIHPITVICGGTTAATRVSSAKEGEESAAHDLHQP